MDEQDLLRRAFAAHFRAAGSGIGQPLQPSKDSDVRVVDGKTYVVLRNVGGILKVYRVRNDGMLKGLKRWPAELE
ncbi:hypothetical protein [Pulveribacter suum]|uniref:hypothetical protein n=1 Tax=Pulveribacter suum TaxID=2116657 RepID=UPI0013006800|nr:hypothetical protein [Pulveribacter suum]